MGRVLAHVAAPSGVLPHRRAEGLSAVDRGLVVDVGDVDGDGGEMREGGHATVCRPDHEGVLPARHVTVQTDAPLHPHHPRLRVHTKPLTAPRLQAVPHITVWRSGIKVMSDDLHHLRTCQHRGHTKVKVTQRTDLQDSRKTTYQMKTIIRDVTRDERYGEKREIK